MDDHAKNLIDRFKAVVTKYPMDKKVAYTQMGLSPYTFNSFLKGNVSYFRTLCKIENWIIKMEEKGNQHERKVEP